MSALSQIPVWVWPLAVGLIWVSAISMRERRTPLVVVYALPLLGILSLRTVSGLEAGPWVWSVFLAGYGLGGFIGWRVQDALILGKSARHVAQRGDKLTAVVIFTLFAMNFALGFIGAVAPAALAGVMVPLGVALVAGLASGTFGGRAFYVAAMPAEKAAGLA